MLVVTSPRAWIFTLAAFGVIERARLDIAQSVIVYLVYVLAVQVLLITPILISMRSPGRVEAAARWLEKYNRPIVVIVSVAVQVVLIATLTVYFLIDGAHLFTWMRQRTPLRWRESIGFFLNSSHRVLGGFLRGVLILACLVSVLSGAAALALGIPFWLIIAVVTFVCEFIPRLGAYISGAIGTALALTAGWRAGLIFLVFATILQGFLNAEILAPRIIGKQTGLNPIVSTFALVVGISLFGITGAVLAIPIAAAAQIFVFAAWTTYRHEHPEDFPDEHERTEHGELGAPIEADAQRLQASPPDSQTDRAPGHDGESCGWAMTLRRSLSLVRQERRAHSS